MEDIAIQLKRIENNLKNLIGRVERIETYLDIEPESEVTTQKLVKNSDKSTEALEFRIGEYWFSKVGIIVFSIGISFLLSLSYENFPPALPSIFGYIISIALLFLSKMTKKTYNYLSGYLKGSALFLLFFSTLRLHFFTELPAISDKNFLLIFLLISTIISIIISIRAKSGNLTAVSLIMGFFTALFSPNVYLTFFIILLMTGIILYTQIKFNWNSLFIFGIFLTYLTHLFWFLNNPILGNKIELVSSPAINIVFLTGYIFVFALGNLFRKDKTKEDNYHIASTFLNCFLGFSLLSIIILTKFKDSIEIVNYSIFILFMTTAAIYWIKEKSKFSTFFYAMFGYAALSIAIINQFEQQNTLVWLCWQSILVVSTAIWFRSKFIIVANFFIYILILLTYITIIDSFDYLSLSFGLAALISARILNWQKDNLELKTEYMRNAYLISAFLIFPYTLYKLLQNEYVILSWIGLSIIYYFLGRFLENKKYRLMALGTLILSVIYIFIIGIIQLEAVYRVISFIVLGIALIITSIIYSRLKKKQPKNERKK